MEHLAIMTKGYIEKILSNEKTVESRFSQNKIAPYGKISAEETVYMKESGKDVSAAFDVADVIFFDSLTEEKIYKIRDMYGKEICADEEFWEAKKNAKYATLIFIKNPRLITPFKIYKNDRSAFKTVTSVRNDLTVPPRRIIKHPHDCKSNKHYFIYDGTSTRCEFCGYKFKYADILNTFPDYDAVKEYMKESLWNEEWLSAPLDKTAESKLPGVTREKIKRILDKSIRVCRQNDGIQTPYSGNPVFYAQHALGLCCRKCLEKFYGLRKDETLTDEALDYFTDLIFKFIEEKRRITVSGKGVL